MFKPRLNLRRLSIWIICLLQLVAIYTYFILQQNKTEPASNSVSFISNAIDNEEYTPTYHTNTSKIIFSDVSTRQLYADFNSSLCFKTGTDLKLMERSQNTWKCACLPGFHGADCGQPEAVWRALLAYRKPIHLKGPKPVERKIIYVFECNDITKIISDVRVNELNTTVDLFVLYEIGSNFIGMQLKNGFLKEFHKKILYVQTNVNVNLWNKIRKNMINLKSEDMVIVSGYNDIPVHSALQYFKLYDNWPEPISFRLRYSVFGFFWIHPNKTSLHSDAFTVRYLSENMANDINLISNKTATKFVIGDLNHYGGWFCEYCNDPTKIIEQLNKYPVKFENLHKIDAEYIEELIENGLYLDGKTALLRAHRFREAYFAPRYLTENTWKYDYLLVNIYSKMDYYE